MTWIFERLARARPAHWLTWTLTLLVATALVLIIVPGEFSNARFDEGTTAWEKRCTELHNSTLAWHAARPHQRTLTSDVLVLVIEHGWPRPFLARALVLKDNL